MNEAVIIRLSETVGVALEVIAGVWGNGEDRFNRLVKAGYDYNKVQDCVNDLMEIISRYE